MGISGLLPLLKSIQKHSSLKKFGGQTIGVDAYGWLHRGTVACAIDLALGKPTRKYVDFSMHRVRMLLHFGIIPYLVFDGDYLPSKAATENDRAQRREQSRKKGLELYHMNKPSQAHLELQKAIEVTPVMARELIEELKKISVQYVVAPYEADAQLVYLEKQGIIQGMLSEDSDLLVFGGKTLLTKLDQYGDCVEIDRADFSACREISLTNWTDAEFRTMAILSGCDYLASITGMGLKNAYRLVRKHKTIDKVLRMLQFDGKYFVPTTYPEAFRRAELTFLHQRVYSPLQNAVVMLTEADDDSLPEDVSFLGAEIEHPIAAAVARGDLDPITKKRINVSKNRDLPVTPGSFKRRECEGTSLLDVKGNKSIDAFFKAKRTPLAELDPNCFTPSPTQARLLQQAAGSSWESPLINTTTSSARASTAERLRPTRNSLTAQSTILSTTEPPLASASTKRRRLLEDVEAQNTGHSEKGGKVVRSHFFANSQDLRSTFLTGRKSRKARNSEIQIWSDDSVEEVMAELPDISELVERGLDRVTKNKEFEVFHNEKSIAKEKAERDAPGEENSAVDDSQTSGSSRRTLSAQASSVTDVTTTSSSASSMAQRLDIGVTAELAALASQYKYRPADQNARRGEEDGRKQDAQAVNEKSVLRPAMGRRASMTPLQRLGAGALKRSKIDCIPSLDSKANSRSSSNHHKIPVLTEDSEPTPSLPFNHSIDPDTSSVRGSEDALVPDSEEELSGPEKISTKETKSRINLGVFVFEG
ncbi:uncharacterized protein KY384_005931 [Bacidia gigantensis]|uniref:uncharacterized protein n=1 Tax=Bacidia gigantensis TaxID=2732470 RepID=UPI001D03E760|nr:uncharacterized protein KY384_005931 [Bacidia gigantensis]KAG8529296.1 hypothetical protein KY384_005931 [Bacidia gigantensis]